MVIKFLKPVTPGSRGVVLVDRSALWKGRPYKPLIQAKHSTGARNSDGRVTVRFRGGGHKRFYRKVDFVRDSVDGVKSVVERVEYDPNRTAFIALINSNGVRSYILAPEGIKVGENVISGIGSDIMLGNTLPLSDIPVGTSVHNIEIKVNAGGIMVRSAGTSARILGRDGAYSMLRMPSGEIRSIISRCRATVGIVSNADNKNVVLGKAGRSRWRGKMPSVRGVAMNPVDHPLGGGEGKTSGGRHPVSPWGQGSLGLKTRKPNKGSSKYIKKVRL